MRIRRSAGTWAVDGVVVVIFLLSLARGRTPVLVVWALFLAARLLVAAWADADALYVRNFFRTRRIPRQEVGGFRIEEGRGLPFYPAVHVVIGGNLLPIEATRRLTIKSWGRPQLEAHLEALRAWERSDA